MKTPRLFRNASFSAAAGEVAPVTKTVEFISSAGLPSEPPVPQFPRLLTQGRLSDEGFSGSDEYNLFFCLENLKAFSSDEHTIECHDNPDSTIPPLASSFSKVNSNILGLADEEGGLILCDISKNGSHALKQEWMAHSNAIFDLEWAYGENKLLTASGDKTVALWDVITEERISTFNSHTSSVKTARFLPNCNCVFVSGGRDGHVHLWDTRVRKKAGGHHPVNSIKNLHAVQATALPGKKRRQSQNQSSQQGVTAAVFQDDNTLITSGSVDGNVKVWDTRKMYQNLKGQPVPKHTFSYAGNSGRSHGFSDLMFDSSKSRLFCSCMDHIVYQYDCAAFTQKPVATFKGHTIDSFYVKLALSPCDRFLLSGSSDANAYIWQVENPMEHPVVLKGHVGEVSAVAWSPDNMTELVTTSDDGTMRVWRVFMGDDQQQDRLGLYVGKAERSQTKLDLQKCEWRTRLCPRPPSPKKVDVLKSPVKICKLTNYTMGFAQSPSKAAMYLKSPVRGTTLKHSPAKISSTVKRAIKELSSGNSELLTSQISKKKLINCSITSWLSKSKGVQCQKRTPRKLLITPKKQQDKTSKTEGLKDSSMNSENKNMGDVGRPTYKRKLTDVFGGDNISSENTQSPSHKKQCRSPGGTESDRILKTVSNTCPENRTKTENCTNVIAEGTVNDLKHIPVDNFTPINLLKTPLRGLNTPIKELNMLSSPVQQYKSPLLNPQNTTPLRPTNIQTTISSPAIKRLNSSPSYYKSPTADLPNYVMKPEPRTPAGKVLNTTPKRTPNWLTQMRTQKDSTKKETEGSSNESEIHSLKKIKSTPKSMKKKSKCSTSIEKFFSPKDTKKS